MLKVASVASRDGRALLARLRARRLSPDFATLRAALPIVEAVLSGGAPVLARFVADLDGEKVAEKGLLVRPGREKDVDPAFASAFRLARRRLTAYHRRQVPKGLTFRDALGVEFVERPVPHGAVGVYVPGGRAFYPSSLLMGVVPARVAGVKRIVVATPPRAFRQSRELRWALAELGVDEVLLAGGAHGIAGLVSVARCTKVVGPGNRWVAAAKHLVSGLVSIDMPAGPSEVLILASGGADPARIAADLLAQAEHGSGHERVWLVTTSGKLLRAVEKEIARQQAKLARRDFTRQVLDRNGWLVHVKTLEEGVALVNQLAPEHCEVMTRKGPELGRRIVTAGAIFLGQYSPTVLGDYVAGPSHTLPTGGAGASFAGLTIDQFQRRTSVVEYDRTSLRKALGAVRKFANIEGLTAHGKSAEIRL